MNNGDNIDKIFKEMNKGKTYFFTPARLIGFCVAVLIIKSIRDFYMCNS